MSIGGVLCGVSSGHVSWGIELRAHFVLRDRLRFQGGTFQATQETHVAYT